MTARSGDTPAETTMSAVIDLVDKAKGYFSGRESLLSVDVKDIDLFFSQFVPGEKLTTSALNPLINSFQWDDSTHVMHSVDLDLDECPNPSEYRRPDLGR